MKLSDIRGEAALDVLADAMELAGMMAGDADFTAFMDDVRALEDKSQAWTVFCRRVPPILRNGRYRDRIISILARAGGVPVEEYAESGNVILDLFELLTSDSETLGFLAASATTGR